MKYFIVILALFLLTGCADNPTYVINESNVHVYGFFGGFWHGMIIVFNLIAMIFSDNVAIYAPSNSGGWYAFGFWLGSLFPLTLTGKIKY
jgi:hypothetical protein